MATLPSLPENWESDYDGKRWFYRYKPTGIIQYIFPKPGDEYPEHIDVFSAPPELSPEERLASQHQVKRRNTAGGDNSPSKTNKKGNGLTSATMSGPADDDENYFYQPDGLMYMGPGGYTDISPEADEDEREEGFGGGGEAGSRQPSRSVDVSPPGGSSSYISPIISAETTPMASVSQPATSTPVLDNTTTVQGAGVGVGADTAQVEATAPPPESPEVEVPLLDGRRIYSPVGYMAELPSELTAQCREETHPAPIELPTHYHMVEAAVQPAIYADAFSIAPVELPTQQSPVLRHAHATALTTPDQKVLVPPVQSNPHPQPTSYQGFAPVNPPQIHQPPGQENSASQHSAPQYTAQQSQSFVVANQPTTIRYQPYNPQSHQAPTPNATPYPTVHRETREDVSSNPNRYSLAALEDVPDVLKPPQVPPKMPLGQDNNAAYMIPGSNSRHESISNPSIQTTPVVTSLNNHSSRVVPSVLQPGGGMTAISRPSLQDHRAHSTPDYRPYHPYEDLEKQIDSITRLYSPPPPQDRESNATAVPPHASQSHSGSMGQTSADITPGINRANTLPTDMPALPFMGFDPSRRPPQAQPIPQLSHPPKDIETSSSQQGQGVLFRDYSAPAERSPDIPAALKNNQSMPTTNAQSPPFQTLTGSFGTLSQIPEAPPKPPVQHQNLSQSGIYNSSASSHGPLYTSHARPSSTQQFHTWQQPAAPNIATQDHPQRPVSVQNVYGLSSVEPEGPRPVDHLRANLLPSVHSEEVRAGTGRERAASSFGGVSYEAITGQQSPAIPDRKTRIQSVDSATGATTRASAASRRVSLSNPSHGFIVENSAMPPPSVQSLRNEGISRQNSPSPPQSTSRPRPAGPTKPRPMSMQFPPSQPPAGEVKQSQIDPYKSNMPSSVRDTSILQPPRSGSPFHQPAHATVSGGPVSGFSQISGQTASSSPSPQSWEMNNKPLAVQRHHSPSPAHGTTGSAPRPLSAAFHPHQTSQLAHPRKTGTEQAERLPAPQPVPLPQPTPPTTQHTASSGTTTAGQARRVPQPVPVPVPQPSPVPQPRASSQSHQAQAPPRPDKIPATPGTAEAAKNTTTPVPSGQPQKPQVPVANLQQSAMTNAQTSYGQTMYTPQLPSTASQQPPVPPPSSQGIQSGPAQHENRTIQTQSAVQQPLGPPSQSRATREHMEKTAALVSSQNYTVASSATTNLTEPPHMQQATQSAHPPFSNIVLGIGPSNTSASLNTVPPPAPLSTQHALVPPAPVGNEQQAALKQPGVFHHNPVTHQPSVQQYIPQVVPGTHTQQIVYMTPGGVPQSVLLPRGMTTTQGGIVPQGPPVLMTTNQPQPSSSPVSSPQNTSNGKEKERWFGKVKVFKSGSVKKQQNPVTVAGQTAGNDAVNKTTAEKGTTETSGRNKLQKHQSATTQATAQPQAQSSQPVFTQTANPVAGAGFPTQAMPFVPGNNIMQMGQQSGPYFQPVGGNLYWSNQIGSVPNTSYVVQQNVPQQQQQQQQQQPPQQPVLTSGTPVQSNPSQAQPRRQSDSYQQYQAANPQQQQQQQQNTNIVYQTHSGGQFFQPQQVTGQHRQSVDQSQGHIIGNPSPGQTRTSAGPGAAQSAQSTNASASEVANPRRPSESSSSLSAPRGSISNDATTSGPVFGGGTQQQRQQPYGDMRDHHEQSDRDSSSRKSISSSIAPSFTNSITTDSGFTAGPRLADVDVSSGNKQDGRDTANGGATAAQSNSFTASTTTNNYEAAAAEAAKTRSMTTTSVTSASSPPISTTATGTGTGTESAAAPQAGGYRALAALRAEQLWGSKARSSGGASTSGAAPIVSAVGSPASSIHEEASASSSPESSPPTAPATASTKSSRAAAAAPTTDDKSKWDSSGYDGSGWGDEDEDEYANAYDYGGGYGGGYR